MYAIASLLDPNSDAIIRSVWERFEAHCGLTGIRSTPLPHFSWQGAEGYQVEAVETELAKAAETVEPFFVHASGIGLFTGVRPVVYVALAKSQRMLTVHQMLWERINPLAMSPNDYYAPARWIPHITLAFRELDVDRLACAVEVIAFEKIEFEIRVDNLALIYTANGKAGLHCQKTLSVHLDEGGRNEFSTVTSRFATQ
jgi:2'-5' RNA ligase